MLPRDVSKALIITVAVIATWLCFVGEVNAQFAATRVEHDWRLTVGNGSFGLVQTVVIPYEQRTTTIYVGPREFTTQLLAVQVAAFVLFPLAGLVGIVLLRTCVRIPGASLNS